MDYDSLSLLQLKKFCKERGLKVSGNRDAVVIRLMENDEEEMDFVPSRQIIQQQIPMGQTNFVAAPTNDKTVAIIFGIGILLYGLFRLGMAMLFGMAGSFFEPVLAAIIGFSFIIAGIITIMGYRNGLFMTMVVLMFSGFLSIVFHEGFGPLSIGLGGVLPITYSLMCSGTCLFMVGIPFLLAGNSLLSGWPPQIEKIFQMDNQIIVSGGESGKIIVDCTDCDTKLRVPSDYSGNITCPDCGNSMVI